MRDAFSVGGLADYLVLLSLALSLSGQMNAIFPPATGGQRKTSHQPGL